MGGSGSRRSRPAPASPGTTTTGGRTFTPLQLFGWILLLLGIGFTAGVVVHAALTASTTPTGGVATAVPAPQPSPLPSLEAGAAIQQLRTHLEHDPGDLDSRLRLANALFDAGRHAEAVLEYEQVLAARPRDADIRTDMGVSLRETGKPGLAAAAFRQAIEVDPGHATAYYNLGVVLAHDLGDAAGAIAAWERYLDLETDPQKQAQVRQGIAELRAR
ncbi:MAG: tetratricopeptide repeat protein [Candidatus Latescibacterota bacterium]|jgi:cytochrome c-type biogenesis protein CcmH/NrfG